MLEIVDSHTNPKTDPIANSNNEMPPVPMRRLTAIEQKALEWEVERYYSLKNSGVRLYPPDKEWSW